MADTISQLENLTATLKKGEELKMENDNKTRELEEVQKQITKAQADLSFIQVKVQEANDQFVKDKKGYEEALGVSKDKFTQVDVKRAEAENELNSLLSSLNKEKQEIIEKN